jgi:acyl carrier protein
MGLDTVELAHSFERYFGCEIPDAVAEKLYTVGDVATWFSQQLGVAGQRHSAVRAAVAAQLLAELPAATTEATSLREALPDAQALKTYRYALRNRYGLVLPPLAALPSTPATPSLWERLTGRELPKASHWHTQTLAELTGWTVAANYEKLLVPPLASQYEVEQAVIGITSYSSGVPVEEIHLQSSFVNDLGMD